MSGEIRRSQTGATAVVVTYVLRPAGVIGPGDEVITTTNTFFARVEAIWLVGATPVFVHIDPATCSLDPGLVEAAITPHTKAIAPVHLYGLCAPMREITRRPRAHGLLVIEDCA
jgi:UDP-2-acetamido-2-deoxy-ribo-hexuluronate aminotransferase